jgi:hypothetical protein
MPKFSRTTFILFLDEGFKNFPVKNTAAYFVGVRVTNKNTWLTLAA